MLKTELKRGKGQSEAAASKSGETSTIVPINFHATKISNPEKKLHALCLVLQPVIVAKNSQAASTTDKTDKWVHSIFVGCSEEGAG